MFRVNDPFYETVLWSAKRVKKVKLFGPTCLTKFAKSLREFLSSFFVIAVLLEVWEFNTEEGFCNSPNGVFWGQYEKKKLLINIKFKNPNWHEAHQLDIYKAQSRHGVQLRATILSKKVLDQL